MAQPVLQPLPVLDLNDHARLHPLWRGVGQLAKVIMQDRRPGEWARLAMRIFEFLEDDRASVRGEAGAAEARVDELPLAIVLSEDQRPPLPGIELAEGPIVPTGPGNGRPPPGGSEGVRSPFLLMPLWRCCSPDCAIDGWRPVELVRARRPLG